MAVLFAEYRIRDLDAFRAEFAAFAPTRRELSAGETRLFTSVDDPLVVTALMAFPTADAARAFAADPRRAAALERAGVVERADEVAEEITAA